VVLPPGWVALVELGTSPAPGDVLVDLTNAAVRGRTDLLPAEAGPEHRLPAPFIESTTPKVVSWCRQQSAERDPHKASEQIAAAIRPKLKPREQSQHSPPSALNMLEHGGGDEGAAALMAACLRALDHPARVVTGCDETGCATWAQMFVNAAWLDVDVLPRAGASTPSWAGFWRTER
jgi:hypothetical protein